MVRIHPPFRLILATLALVALALLPGCQTGTTVVVPGAGLAGAWQAAPGEQVFWFGSELPLTYLSFHGNGSGSGGLFAADPVTNVLGCAKTTYAATSGNTLLLYNESVLGTVLLTYAMPTPDTLVLTTDSGASQTLSRVTAVPAAAQCDEATVAQSFEDIPLDLSYQSNLLVDGGTLEVAGSDRKIYPVSSSSGALGVGQDLVSGWSHAVALQAGSYWGHCWCGNVSDIRRVQVGGTELDSINTGTDLGRELQLYTGTWDGSRLWLSGYSRDDNMTHLLKVDSNAEPDVLEADFGLPSFEPRGLAFHDGALWAVSYVLGYKVVRIDPATGLVTQTITLPSPPSGYGYSGIAWLGTQLWVMTDNSGTFSLFRMTF